MLETEQNSEPEYQSLEKKVMEYSSTSDWILKTIDFLLYIIQSVIASVIDLFLRPVAYINKTQAADLA